MIVRPATASDLDAIARIQAASPEASHWDPASYLNYRCTVAEEGENILGFLVFRPVAPAEYEILNLAVNPAARRRGVARRLLASELAQNHGEWFLEVRGSNRTAIQLYEKLGFKPVGRRESYYRDPPEPGIVMKFDS
jgi:ribosomal-protein-alanine N-acetyltransferase